VDRQRVHLTLAAFILLGGSLGDRLGRRRVFVVGVVWFALASLLCALAPTSSRWWWPGDCRASGRSADAGHLAILQASFRPGDGRGRSGRGPGSADRRCDRPVPRRLAARRRDWRWIVLINLPLAAVIVLVARRHVPESADPAGHRATSTCRRGAVRGRSRA
jgi:MFS family permease